MKSEEASGRSRQVLSSEMSISVSEQSSALEHDGGDKSGKVSMKLVFKL